RACRQADVLLGEKASTTSPLLMAQQFQRNQDWAEQLHQLRQKVESISAQLLDGLKSLDQKWTEAMPGPDRKSEQDRLLTQLDGICSLFGYVARWQTQLREREFQLTL